MGSFWPNGAVAALKGPISACASPRKPSEFTRAGSHAGIQDFIYLSLISGSVAFQDLDPNPNPVSKPQKSLEFLNVCLVGLGFPETHKRQFKGLPSGDFSCHKDQSISHNPFLNQHAFSCPCTEPRTSFRQIPKVHSRSLTLLILFLCMISYCWL